MTAYEYSGKNRTEATVGEDVKSDEASREVLRSCC